VKSRQPCRDFSHQPQTKIMSSLELGDGAAAPLPRRQPERLARCRLLPGEADRGPLRVKRKIRRLILFCREYLLLLLF
jgi:hypothetical protein